MKNSKKQAFPMGNIPTEYNKGLTKREYAAIMVLQGMLSNQSNNSKSLYGVNGNDEIGFIAHKEIAIAAIIYADELLKQIEQK